MKKYIWILPAALSIVFFLFSLEVVVTEGLFGFLNQHTRNGWGAQIGIDLFSAAGLALFFAAPLARRHGIRMAPWILLTLCTGSIGLFALAARILHARGASSVEAGAERLLETQARAA